MSTLLDATKDTLLLLLAEIDNAREDDHIVAAAKAISAVSDLRSAEDYMVRDAARFAAAEAREQAREDSVNE